MKGAHRRTLTVGETLAPGDYFYRPGIGWCGVTPSGYAVDLTMFDATLHDDGSATFDETITIYKADSDEIAWRGRIERGVWSEC